MRANAVKGLLRCGKIIAVKKIFSIHLVEDDQFQREARYLIGIKHQNIVKLVGYCAESRWQVIKLPNGHQIMAEVPTRLLCFEYICNQSLDKHVSDESSGLDWNKRFEIIMGICSGLHFLHEKRIVHLDLKPGNIVMDATMIPKIADFGLSRLLGIGKSRTIISGNRAGSLGYMAPEYIYQGEVSPKADIFSFGVMIIEIITGCKTNDEKFLQSSGSHQSIEISRQQYIEDVLGRWRNIFKKEPKYTRPEIYSQQVRECITVALRCMDDKSRRPNASEIFQMLGAVESTKFHTKYIKDSAVYQGVARNGGIVDVKKLPNTFGTDVSKYKELLRAANQSDENMVRLLGYCADTINVKILDYEAIIVMADVRERPLCLEYLPKGSLRDYFTDESLGLDWSKRFAPNPRVSVPFGGRPGEPRVAPNCRRHRTLQQPPRGRRH